MFPHATRQTNGRTPRGAVRFSCAALTLAWTVGAGSACEIDPDQKKQAEAKLDEAQKVARQKLGEAHEVARERIDEARPEVERAVGELKQGAQRGYDRASSNLEEATSYQPIDGASDAIACVDDVCTVDKAFAAQFAQHPEWLARELKISPAFRGGKIHGLRVVYVPAGSLADLLGLRAGDVVTTVDGKSITSIADLQSLAEQSPRRPRDIVIAYLRGGEARTLTLRQGPTPSEP